MRVFYASRRHMFQWRKMKNQDIVTCQAHPALVKKANQMCGSFLFFLNLVSLASCLVAARSPGWVCWRPHLAGTRQYKINIDYWIWIQELQAGVPCQLQTHRWNYRTGNGHSWLKLEGNCLLLHSASRALVSTATCQTFNLNFWSRPLTLIMTFDLNPNLWPWP